MRQTAISEGWVRNGDVHIFYYTVGSGPAVLFLHGFPDSSDIWRLQAAAIAERGYRAVVPDLRGFGQSSKPTNTEAYRLKEAAEDVFVLLDDLQVDRCHLVSHDWGAALAWHIASRSPGRLRCLVALSTGHPAAFFSAGGNAQRQRSWYCLFMLHPGAGPLLAADGWAAWRQLMASEKPALVDAQIARMSRDGALAAGLEWYRANMSLEQFAASRAPAPLQRLCVPVLGVWSDGDPFLTEEQMTGSARFVEQGMFSYSKIRGASHWVQLEAAEKVNRLLLGFLSKVERQSRL